MGINITAGKRQVETVIYLASLASEPHAIESILDDVRSVTATMSPNAELTAEQSQLLKTVEEQLVRYLTEEEPVRDFTKDTLRDRIEARFAGGLSFSSLRWMLFWTLLVTLCVGAVLLMLPLDLTAKARFQMVGSTVFGILPAGAAIFFFTALRTFKPQLQRAYQLICLGMLVFGVSMLAQPILDFNHVRESPYGAFAIAAPMLIAFAMIYLGIRRYLGVIGLTSRLYQTRTLFIVLTIGSIIAIILPHANIPDFPEFFFDLSAALLIQLGLLNIMTGLMLLGIAKHSAQIYASAHRGLGIALILAGSGALYILLLRCLLGAARPDGPYALSILAFIIAGLLFLWVGYAFNRAGRY
jgi:hypothetical protein